MPQTTQSAMGLIGLGTMGTALARNLLNHKITLSVYNRSTQKTHDFVQQYGGQGFDTYKTFVASLHSPRIIMLMVDAGPAVDAVITDLLPHLAEGDCVIDGGNSYYKDTQRRSKALAEKNIHFVGMGVSGGEEGALHGPSLMPGCTKDIYTRIAPIFKKIAAKDTTGKPCITHVGTDGAGQYVKMVHNGIEYGIMQLFAEVYDLYKTVYHCTPPEIATILRTYNKGVLRSFLCEISAEVLEKKDDQPNKRGYLIDAILDTAAQKGTGKWTSLDTLDRGIPLPTITESVFARYLSAQKELRVSISKHYPFKKTKKQPLTKTIIHNIEQGLYTAIISTYAQGYALIDQAAKEEQWSIRNAEVSRIWQGGCIIRADVLTVFEHAYKESKKQSHLFEIPAINTIIKKRLPSLRNIAIQGIEHSVAMPAMTSALSYIDGITRATSPANMIQGLRDHFGAHTYERIDKPGSFHSIWK
jgi:6-phosphogluconate dehydrogenase